MKSITTNILRLCGIVGLITTGAACGPSLTMDGARVKVAKNLGAPTCESVTQFDVEGSSMEHAETLLRNKTAEAHGNAVTITENTENNGRVRLVGTAYNCHAM